MCCKYINTLSLDELQSCADNISFNILLLCIAIYNQITPQRYHCSKICDSGLNGETDRRYASKKLCLTISTRYLGRQFFYSLNVCSSYHCAPRMRSLGQVPMAIDTLGTQKAVVYISSPMERPNHRNRRRRLLQGRSNESVVCTKAAGDSAVARSRKNRGN